MLDIALVTFRIGIPDFDIMLQFCTNILHYYYLRSLHFCALSALLILNSTKCNAVYANLSLSSAHLCGTTQCDFRVSTLSPVSACQRLGRCDQHRNDPCSVSPFVQTDAFVYNCAPILQATKPVSCTHILYPTTHLELKLDEMAPLPSKFLLRLVFVDRSHDVWHRTLSAVEGSFPKVVVARDVHTGEYEYYD